MKSEPVRSLPATVIGVPACTAATNWQFLVKIPLLLAQKYPRGERSGGQTAPLRHQQSNDAFDHHAFDMRNRLGWVQTLGAGLRTVHDCMAAIKLEGVFQLIQPLACRFIAAVNDPTIGMQQSCWPQIAVAVPPI